MPLRSTSLNGSFVGPIVPQPLQQLATTKDVVQMIIKTAIPLSCSQLAQFFISSVVIAFAGQLGVSQLGGASLAFGFINATAFSFSAGFCGALETVLSHTFGRNPTSKMYGVYTQRMVLILLATSVLLAPLIVYVDKLLLLLGQNEDVVHYTGIFCRVAMWGMVPAMGLELLRRYYACQLIINPPSVNLMVGAALNPVLLFVMIHFFGFHGAPLAWVVLMTGMSASLVYYLWYTGLYKNTWGGWDERAYRNFGPLLRLAFPSMAMIMSEWVALEVNSICAGFDTPQGLAGFMVTYQVSSLLWSNLAGVYFTASVRIGNAIGEGQPALARKIAYCSLGLTFAGALLNLVFLFLVRHHVVFLFTDDEEVTDIFLSILPIYVGYHIFDTFQSCMMGILRGCGLQRIGAVVIGIAYSVVGVPFGLILFFGLKWDVRALWVGPLVGVGIFGFPVYMYLLFVHIKWAELLPHPEEGAGDVQRASSTENGISGEQAPADVVVIESSPVDKGRAIEAP